MRRVCRPTGLCALLVTLMSPAAARATDVELRLSSRETFVNVPVEIEVVVKDAERYSRPQPPAIKGASIQLIGGPNKSSRVSIVNGVTTSTVSYTYTYQLVPREQGKIVVGPFAIEADGKTYRTKPQILLVTESETNDLMFVDVVADKDAVFVGEELSITLQIWLRPFKDIGYELSEQDMWQMVSQRKSTWGSFAEALENSKVTVRSAYRRDSEGQTRAYYVYELKTTMWAERAGQFDPGDVSIVVSYPTQLGRSRDPFDIGFRSRSRLSVTQARTLAQAPEVAPIEIKPIPLEGRPSDFTGAVGKYSILATAKPSEVGVGDPVTLTLTITGRGRLETLQPPPLAELPQLTADFQIPPDPIAGIVKGASKQFTQSIRPVRDEIAEIPQIPFSYFDPVKEKFVTIHTEPIPLTVKESHTLALADIVEANGGSVRSVTELKELGGGILANYTGSDVLSRQGFALGWASAGALALPPIVFLLSMFVQYRQERLRSDLGYGRRRRARRVAQERLQDARSASGETLVDALAEALTGYVADRCDLPVGVTRDEVVQTLRERKVSESVICDVDQLLEAFENARYAGLTGNSDQDWIQRIEQCVSSLDKEGL